MSEETQTQEEITPDESVVATVEVSQNVDTSKKLFDEYYADVTKLYKKGTASAGARARKTLSTLSKLFKVIRNDIQETKRNNAASKVN